MEIVRIAAHAAPVFDGWDPIAGTRQFYESGVTQTASIEPRTPEGEIYTTQPFAALAIPSGDRSFDTQYVGTLPTAKDYGEFPLFALRRTREPLFVSTAKRGRRGEADSSPQRGLWRSRRLK